MIPFSLDERANPEGCIHSFFLNDLNELDQIIVAFEVELPKMEKNQVKQTVPLE